MGNHFIENSKYYTCQYPRRKLNISDFEILWAIPIIITMVSFIPSDSIFVTIFGSYFALILIPYRLKEKTIELFFIVLKLFLVFFSRFKRKTIR